MNSIVRIQPMQYVHILDLVSMRRENLKLNFFWLILSVSKLTLIDIRIGSLNCTRPHIFDRTSDCFRMVFRA